MLLLKGFLAVSWLFFFALRTDARRCCPNGSVLLESRRLCVTFATPQSTKMAGGTTASLNCEDGSFILDPHIDKEEKFRVVNGSLEVHRVQMGETYIVDPGEYCVTDFISDVTGEKNTTAREIAVLCFGSAKEEHSIPQYLSISLLISSLLLFITFGVYCLLPELRDVQGICMMNFVIALAIGYMSLASLQLWISDEHSICVVAGYFTYFWLLVAFFWLNVVCFNIWRFVKCRRSRFPIAENRLRVIYFSYAWLVPLCLLIVVVIVDAATSFEHILRPGFGSFTCWFVSLESTWFYFNGPVTMLLVTNIIFFVGTLVCLRNEERLPPVPGLRSVKFKACLYLKLFIVMGLCWIFEMVSSLFHLPIWAVTDVVNGLQGVFVFIVVVCRTRVVRGLVKKFGGPSCLRRWAHGYDAEQDEEVEQLAINEDGVKGRTAHEDHINI